MWLVKYVWHFMLGAGVLLFACAAFSGYRTWRMERSLERVQGTVTRTWTGGKLGLDFQAEVQFTPSDGQRRTFTTAMNSREQLRAGRAVGLVFDRDEPEHPRVEFGRMQPWSGMIDLALWGAGISLLGAAPLWFNLRKERRVEWLQLNGRAVEADLTGVRFNTDLIINGKSPWQVTARWRDQESGNVWQFKSENLWQDPSQHLLSKTVSVVVDPANPAHYWMDLWFLPHAS